jgi:hypothetical protein
MQLVIDFILYLCVYSTCFERQAPIIRSPLTVHTASSFLCLCLSAALSCKKLLVLLGPLPGLWSFVCCSCFLVVGIVLVCCLFSWLFCMLMHLYCLRLVGWGCLFCVFSVLRSVWVGSGVFLGG